MPTTKLTITTRGNELLWSQRKQYYINELKKRNL